MSVKSKIQSLIAAANSKTGESDTTLTDAVQTLVDGYGQGGGLTLDGFCTLAEPSGAVVYTGTAAVGGYAFYGRTAVTSFSAPNLARTNAIGQVGLAYATRMTSVSLPKVKTLASGVFTGCTALTSVDMPLFEEFSSGSIFYNCSNLVEIHLPNCNRLNDRTFQGCTKLKRVILNTNKRAPSTSAFGTYCFYGTALDTLVLGGTADALWKLGNINAFDNSPFKSGGTGGTIYIPKALYDHLGDGSSLDYQSATNWSTLHSRGTVTWAKIEGSVYET